MVETKLFKEKLEVEKGQLEEQLSGIARLNELTGVWEVIPDQDLVGEIDDNDAADRFEDFEERSGTANTLQARLRDIDAAIAKIGAGTYGICEIDPKHEVEIARLEANPAARTCKEHMNS